MVRVGGDLEMLKAFIAAGFPVMVEKGFEGEGFDGWMGHYQVVNGYDDAAGQFIVQDSYKGPDLPIPYDQFLSDWRAFNYTYLVIYPAERRQQVLAILGLQAYDNFNNQAALQKADAEVSRLTGRTCSCPVQPGRQPGGAARLRPRRRCLRRRLRQLCPDPRRNRPWRMLWYQTGPYFAYYYTGRYQDVINLATQTLDAMSEPILEESYYWRGRAYLALAIPMPPSKTCNSAWSSIRVSSLQCRSCKMGIEPPPTPVIQQ